MPIEATELERYSVKFGDLMVCEGGDVGRAAIGLIILKCIIKMRFTE